jgi:hypothetical protein
MLRAGSMKTSSSARQFAGVHTCTSISGNFTAGGIRQRLHRVLEHKQERVDRSEELVQVVPWNAPSSS